MMCKYTFELDTAKSGRMLRFWRKQCIGQYESTMVEWPKKVATLVMSRDSRGKEKGRFWRSLSVWRALGSLGGGLAATAPL